MSRISNDDQFHFLISCIRHSNHGKVDFTKVAGECEIISRGAAAKRYGRMMKAHGITPNSNNTGTGTGTSDVTPSPSPDKKRTAPGTGNKRKTAGADADTGTHGEGEGGDPETPSKKRGCGASEKGQAMKDKAVESAERVALKGGGGGVKKEEKSVDDEVFYGAIKREAVEDA